MATTVNARTRWRFTIGGLMIGIAAVAGVLALPGFAGLLAGALFLMSLILIAARWLVEGGTRNRPLAAGTFWAVALWVNLVAVVSCITPDYGILGMVFLGTGFVRVAPSSAATIGSSPIAGSDLRVNLGGGWSYRQDD